MKRFFIAMSLLRAQLGRLREHNGQGWIIKHALMGALLGVVFLSDGQLDQVTAGDLIIPGFPPIPLGFNAMATANASGAVTLTATVALVTTAGPNTICPPPACMKSVSASFSSSHSP